MFRNHLVGDIGLHKLFGIFVGDVNECAVLKEPGQGSKA
jgi:hypothetical protein